MKRHKPPTQGQQIASWTCELPEGEMKPTRSFWLKAQFQQTHTKETESQDLLLTDSWTEGLGGQDSPPSQVMREQGIESRAACAHYCWVIVLPLTFWLTMHLKLIFVYRVRYWPKFNFPYGYLVDSASFSEDRSSFFQCTPMSSLSLIRWLHVGHSFWMLDVGWSVYLYVNPCHLMTAALK